MGKFSVFLVALFLGRAFDQFSGCDIGGSLLLLCGHFRVTCLVLLSFGFRSRKVGVAVGDADATCVDLGLVRVLVLKSS